MDLFGAAGMAVHELFSLWPIVAFIGIVPIALMSGMMPGTGLPITVVVLGFATKLNPIVAIVLVLGSIGISEEAEAIPAILLGVPGNRASQATILDGYPMARKGLAGEAIGANYTASAIGGLIGGAILFASIPVARAILREFGSAEFFLLGLLGVLAVAVVSSGAVVKGLLTGALGFVIALIGFSPIGGVVRTTFGIGYIWNGVPLVPMVVGLFAIPELVNLVVSGQSIARERRETLSQQAARDVWNGMVHALHHKWLILRSSLIGVFVGIMPGLGASAAHWIAYAQARQTEKGAVRTFGTGDVRGVIGSDAARNASGGGTLIPTVFFSIPGSGGSALLLAMLILMGFTPGPSMITDHLDVVMVMVLLTTLSVVTIFPIQLFFGGPMAKLSLVPPNLIVPVVVGILALATYQTSNSMGDLVSMLVFGLLGMFMKAYGWPRPPILIALVLSPIVEKYLWLSINTYGFHMFLRPQFSLILVAVALLLVWSVRTQAKARAALKAMQSQDGEAAAASAASAQRSSTPGYPAAFPDPPAGGSDGVVRTRKWLTLEFIGEATLLTLTTVLFATMFAESFGWPEGAALMPRIAISFGTIFLILRVIALVRTTRATPRAAGRIMDIGFTIPQDRKVATRRFGMIVGAIVGIVLLIWLVGWFIALPLWVFGYLRFVGKVRWWWAVLTAGLFWGVVYGVYDKVLYTTFNGPVLFVLYHHLFG